MDTRVNVGITPTEAERIISHLEDGIEKIAFLDSITPDVLQHRDELSRFIGEEISKAMTEQKALERHYEELIEQRAAMKGMVNKTKYKEVQEEIQDVSRALRESTNNLVRNLKENPNVSGNMMKVERDRKELHDLLLRCTQELRDRGLYQTITLRVDEENNSRIRHQQLKTREKALRETVAKLNDRLIEEQKVFARTSADQKATVAKLKEELQILKSSTSTDSKFKRKESLASVSAIWREFRHKERQLEARLKELEDKLQTEQLVNHDTKEFLNRKNDSLDAELAYWGDKYEHDSTKMTTEIFEIESKQTKLREKLVVLQERKKMEDKLSDEKKKAGDLEAELKVFEKALDKKKNKAARVITKTIRKYADRLRELKALNPPKTKGKGAKGGKKKK